MKVNDWNALLFKQEIDAASHKVRDIVAIASKYVKLDLPADFVGWVENADKNCMKHISPRIWIASKHRYGIWDSYVYCLNNIGNAKNHIRGEEMESVWCAVVGSNTEIKNLPSGWTVVDRELVRR